MARERIIDGDSGRIVASVFETTEAIEEDLEDVSSLFVRVEIEISEYPTHGFYNLFLFLLPNLFSWKNGMRGKKRIPNFDSDFASLVNTMHKFGYFCLFHLCQELSRGSISFDGERVCFY